MIRARGITLLNAGGARVFRYNQGPPLAAAGRGLGSNPVHIPLPFDRWSRHFNFSPSWLEERDDPKTKPARKEQLRVQIQNWLHHFIPTCMLQHGLASSGGI